MIETTLDITTADGAMETFVCRPERDGPHPAVFFLMDAPGADVLADAIIRQGVAAAGYNRAPQAGLITRLKEAGVRCIPTCGAVKHVQKAAQLGADAIIVQGGEGGGHTGVVDHRAAHAGPQDQALEDLQKVASLTQKPVRRRICPGPQLAPGLIGCRLGAPPEPAVRSDADELVAAGPRNGPGPVAFGKLPQNTHRLFVHPGLTPVRVDEHVGVDRDHGSPGCS